MLTFFAQDHDDRFPDADWNDDGKNDPRGQWWFLPLRPYYIEQPDILICSKARVKQDLDPSADWFIDGRYRAKKSNECWGRKIISTPHPDYGEWFWSSYAPNAWIMDPSKGKWGADLPDEVFWGKFINITQPSQVPIFLDSKSVDAWPHHTDRPNSQETDAADGQGSMRSFTMIRHKKSINGVMGDGSINRIRLTDLWKYKWSSVFNTNNPLTKDDYAWPDWMK